MAICDQELEARGLNCPLNWGRFTAPITTNTLCAISAVKIQN